MGNTEEFTSIEWFAGGAGNHQGLSRVIPNLRCIAFCEREGYAVSNLVAAMEEGRMAPAPIWTDCRTFPVEPFLDRRLDLFIASYPCQGESVAGNQLGTEDPRFLWPYCREFVAAVRPVYCFFENVRGHVNQSMVEVLRDLAGLQYAVEPGIFSAEECGGSHSRERVFILAKDMAYASSQQDNGERRIDRLGGEALQGHREAPFRNDREAGHYGTSRRCQSLAHSPHDNRGSGERGAEAGAGETGAGETGVGRRGSAIGGSELVYSDNGRPQGGPARRTEIWDSGAGDLRPAATEPSGNLEHSEGLGRGEGRTKHELWSGRCAAAEPSGEVAYTEPARLRTGGFAKCGASYAEPLGSGEVADAFDQGLQGEQQRGTLLRSGDGQETYGPVGELRRSCLPQSPPGPDDAAEWYRVLFHRPELAPSLRRSEAERIFRRVADGMADKSYLHELRGLFCENRVDRLRMLGNGVFPYSAAVAWVMLNEKMNRNL